jgi:hypothetical protein
MAPKIMDPELEAALGHSEEVIYLLGGVVTAWSALDDSLIRLLAKIAKCPLRNAGIIYFSVSSMRARLNILKSLAQHALANPDDAGRVLPVIDTALELNKKRNGFIHASYPLVHNPRLRRRKWRMKRIGSRPEKVLPVAALDAQTGDLKTHVGQVNALRLSVTLAL